MDVGGPLIDCGFKNLDKYEKNCHGVWFRCLCACFLSKATILHVKHPSDLLTIIISSIFHKDDIRYATTTDV